MTLHLIQSTEEQREAEILRLCDQFGKTRDRSKRKAIYKRVMDLRAQRSADFIRRMEKQQGLSVDENRLS